MVLRTEREIRSAKPVSRPVRISRRVIYAGRVQGVGFRYSVKQIAAGFDATGWVRNLPDGTVELLAAGEASEVESFLDAVASSHLSRHIQQTQRSDADAAESPGVGFEIRHQPPERKGRRPQIP